jgi:subtilisin family serine protease
VFHCVTYLVDPYIEKRDRVLDFTGRVGAGANCLSGSCRADGSVNDDNGHGTHVAGTAAGTCYGVAKAATVHPVKVFDASGSGAYTNIIAGMGWVRGHVRANGNWPAVVSMSLGGSSSPAVNQAVADLAAARIPVVAAAGNNYGGDACSTSPGGAAAAITVGSTDRSDAVSSFSNVGRCVDIYAPGGQITSDGNQGDSATKVLSGTSMATPHVSGAVALALQASRGASPQQIGEALARAAVALPALRSTGSPNRFLQATQKLAP